MEEKQASKKKGRKHVIILVFHKNHALIFGRTDGKYGVYYIIGWCSPSNLTSLLLPHPHSSSYGESVGHHNCPALGEGQWRLWPPPFLTMTYASKICILQTICICQFDSELNHTIKKTKTKNVSEGPFIQKSHVCVLHFRYV